MARKTLIEKVKTEYFSKDIEIVDNPKQLLPALNNTGLKVLTSLHEKPAYPSELAKKLKINEQNIYYFIREFLKFGLIKKVEEKEIHGAVAKYYAPVSGAFGFELAKEKKKIKIGEFAKEEKLKDFLHEFIEHSIFDATIVVGSPVRHGPYLTAARDGHYAVQLGFFVGNFTSLSEKFIVELDTDIKAEKGEKQDMMLVGGPVANMICSEINEHLSVKFNWDKFWTIYSKITKKAYSGENVGLIAKIKNPWDKSKSIILLAGIHYVGTQACVLGLTKKYSEILKDYEKEKEFYKVIEGLDKDGDGKIDDIKILE
jgi:predicted transcriptional regulator